MHPWTVPLETAAASMLGATPVAVSALRL